MKEKSEEEKVLEMAAIRRLKTIQLSDWEKDFIDNCSKKGELTENQKKWLNKLKEKYLQKK